MNNVTNSRQTNQSVVIKVCGGSGEVVKISEDLCTKSAMSPSLVLDELAEEIYAELCDDLIFALILQTHRASKLGYLFYLQPEATSDAKFQIFEHNDVIGVFSHLNADVTSSSTSSNKSQGTYSVEAYLADKLFHSLCFVKKNSRSWLQFSLRLQQQQQQQQLQFNQQIRVCLSEL